MTRTDHIVLIGEPDQATSAGRARALSAMFTAITTPDENGLLCVLRTRPIVALVLEPTLFSTDSWQRLATISQICAAQQVSLIICSTLDERHRGAALGAAAYLVKPTLPTTLLDTLRQICGNGEHYDGFATASRLG